MELSLLFPFGGGGVVPALQVSWVLLAIEGARLEYHVVGILIVVVVLPLILLLL
jgi:hypothetical protein